ncbi:hypothetical protein [Pseudomonas sp. dw_612]|uniref:hypothetical protein n=1 Tax=Pseudomonas sp. dw_612 TaxID=2720080 RepID=UPI001BD3F74F|nr:hypothetical protein [Pseudomonas sp. dw_612]
MSQKKTAAEAGTLDLSFNGTGVVHLPFPFSQAAIPGAVYALPDSKLLVAVVGITLQNGDIEPAKLVRLREDGAVDDTFDIPFAENWIFSPSQLQRIKDSDGVWKGWLVFGRARQSSNSVLAVAKLHEDFTFDAPFGDGGVVFIDVYELPGIEEGAKLVNRRPDATTDESFSGSTGRGGGLSGVAQVGSSIVLADTIEFEFDNLRGVVIRLTENGSLDQSFNDNGYVLVELPGVEHNWNYAWGVGVQNDGKILVSGDFQLKDSGHPPGAYVLRFTQHGKVDSGYASNGVFTLARQGQWCSLEDITLRADGGIISVGYVETEGAVAGLAIVLTSSGAPNLVFNDGKPLLSNFPEHGVVWHHCMVQADNKLIFTGWGGGRAITVNSSLVTARYLPNGQLDKLYGGEGYTVFNDESGRDYFRNSTVMGDNRVVVCGFLSTTPAKGNVVRYLG